MIELSCFSWVQLVKKARLPSGANHIALYLATFMNAEHNIAWPSIARISHETGLSKPTVIKWLSHLDSLGWLNKSTSTRSFSTLGGCQQHNEYQITIPDKVVKSINQLPQGSKTVDERGLNESSKVVKPFNTNNNINNNINNNKHFVEFWKKYPKKKSKGDAEKAWVKIKPDNIEPIMEALSIAVNSPDWLKDNGQFIPYPATWLRAKGWEDEVEVSSDSYGDGAI